jgi:hypothetical protein
LVRLDFSHYLFRAHVTKSLKTLCFQGFSFSVSQFVPQFSIHFPASSDKLQSSEQCIGFRTALAHKFIEYSSLDLPSFCFDACLFFVFY